MSRLFAYSKSFLELRAQGLFHLSIIARKRLNHEDFGAILF
jgi:hypothetical protein